jgi:hypothetical protein
MYKKDRHGAAASVVHTYLLITVLWFKKGKDILLLFTQIVESFSRDKIVLHVRVSSDYAHAIHGFQDLMEF